MMRDPDGFSEFVEGHSRSLMRTAFFLTGDAHRAEDLLQAALAKAWPKWGRIRFEHPEAYIRATMLNQRTSWWRSRSRAEVPIGVIADRPDSRPTSSAVLVEDRMTLVAAIARLPRRQREVIVLRFVEDRSVSETSALLGCAEGTVKAQTARALERLRDLLHDTYPREARK